MDKTPNTDFMPNIHMMLNSNGDKICGIALVPALDMNCHTQTHMEMQSAFVQDLLEGGWRYDDITLIRHVGYDDRKAAYIASVLTIEMHTTSDKPLPGRLDAVPKH